MQIEARIKYEEEYLPTKRHRIPRVRKAEETVTVELREVKRENAPVAMIVTDYQSYLDENGQDQFGLRNSTYVAVENELYSEKRNMWGALDKGPYSMEEFLKDIDRVGDCDRSWRGKSREDIVYSLNEFMNSHLLIDGLIHEQKGEPRYVVQTFGLGHNHGGTAMLITGHYNPNIGKDRYFSALERDKAIAYADKIASARGDTKNIGTFGQDINIEVFMPEMVLCDPQLEHGAGNPLLNSLEDLVQSSSSAMEAGLFVLGAASTQFTDKKPSLDDQIHSAAGRSADSDLNKPMSDRTVFTER